MKRVGGVRPPTWSRSTSSAGSRAVLAVCLGALGWHHMRQPFCVFIMEIPLNRFCRSLEMHLPQSGSPKTRAWELESGAMAVLAPAGFSLVSELQPVGLVSTRCVLWLLSPERVFIRVSAFSRFPLTDRRGLQGHRERGSCGPGGKRPPLLA